MTMTETTCPPCGEESLRTMQGSFRFEPPPDIPGGTMIIPNPTWQHCTACNEDIVPHELDQAIDRERYNRLGLLTPDEIRRVREKTGLSAVDMSLVLGVGEKTYTRWVNGTTSGLQREANEFAADLLFLGDRFSIEANAKTISAATVKELAAKYQASYEATARRFIQNNFRPCMLVLFKRQNHGHTPDTALQPTWMVRYCIASPTFKTRFFEKINGTVPSEVVATVTAPGRDIADSHVTEIGIANPLGNELRFQGEFFFNTYNIFCLLTPT
jgi:DNA-binding transcriptional regulator YiaG